MIALEPRCQEGRKFLWAADIANFLIVGIKQAVDAGVNVVVAGSAIFGKPDIAEAVRELREAAV